MDVLHLAGALMEHFLKGIAPLRHWYFNPNDKDNEYKSSLTYKNLNGVIPSRKCSIKASAKYKTSIYVLTEICLQRRK